MDKLSAINAFVQAAETRSFVEAGRQLGMSPSAVGKAVARLEDDLLVRLLQRSTRSMALTEEGALYLECCRQLLLELERTEARLPATSSALRGVLRVSLPIAGMLLVPAISKFMQAYPDINLDLDFTDRLVDVIEEGFDVVIRAGGAADSRLMSRRIGSVGNSIVASPAYLARRGTPSTPEDLLGHDCLHYRYPSTGRLEPWPLERNGQRLELPLPTRACSSTIEPLAELAEAGFGITCLPHFAVERRLATGSLVSALRDYLVTQRVFLALWPSSRYLAPKVRAFVDHMADNLFSGI
jgi:DNA-binding transcriptional LysR family regulator